MAASTLSLKNNVAFLHTMLLMKPNNPGKSTPSRLADNCIPMVQSFQVIQVVQIPAVTFEWIEHPIFLVLCKHPSTDASLDWDDTMPNHFLHHLSQSSNSPGTERLLGALAIGKKVKFYRFDGKV